jgi:hypothetical protein
MLDSVCMLFTMHPVKTEVGITAHEALLLAWQVAEQKGSSSQQAPDRAGETGISLRSPAVPRSSTPRRSRGVLVCLLVLHVFTFGRISVLQPTSEDFSSC